MKKEYVFITYGSDRIRGVQTKAINIGELLPKEKVLIINHGDSSWLEASGLDVLPYDFNNFSPVDPESELAKILADAKVIIFCDFPTNMFFSAIIFWYVYKNLSIPLCICENMYNNSQFDDHIYKLFYTVCDRILLSGLHIFSNYLNEFPKAKLLPPLFTSPDILLAQKENLLNKFEKSSPNQKIIFYIAYNKQVFSIVQKVIMEYKDERVLHCILTPQDITPETSLPLSSLKNVYLITRKLRMEEICEIIASSDIIVCKFGYQQFLESLSLGKPTICIGDSGLEKSWLDSKLQEVLQFFPAFSTNLLGELNKLVTDATYYNSVQSKIKKLHNNTFDGAKIAANEIMSLSDYLPKREKLSKILIVSFNTKTNSLQIQKLCKIYPFAFPFIISNRFAERDFGYPKGTDPLLENLSDIPLSDEIIDTSFSLIVNFSNIAYHGVAPILPFIETLFSSFSLLCIQSDKICVVGKEAQNFFKQTLAQDEVKRKVEFIDT